MRGECPSPRPDCRLAGTGCFTDVHHDYFPRKEYRTRLEKLFREHLLNKQVMCREEHQDFHANNQPPEKPSREEMLRLLGDSYE